MLRCRKNLNEEKMMAGVTGLEPAASGVTGRRSNQLSYTPSGEIRWSVFSTVFIASNPKNTTKNQQKGKKDEKKQAVRPMITYGREHKAN